MKIHRRGFLRIAGSSILCVAVKPLFHVVTKWGQSEASQTVDRLGGKKWAMIVDLKKCLEKEKCKDCIDACHQVHNVPDLKNPKDEIKWIWTVQYEKAFPEQEHEFIETGLKGKPALVLCNHCDDPPCVRVCPTKATWKREDGIVMMDYHRCIGCRYCMAACPYGSRSFNWKDPRPNIKKINMDFPTRTKGVVEKCSFCQERLAKDLLPVCVEACKEKALIFGDLEDSKSDVRNVLSEHFAIRRKPSLGTKPKVFYLV